MSITRRQFLLGTSAGLILPSYFDRAVTYFENHGEPLLEAQRNPRRTLYAINHDGEGFQLCLDSLDINPPGMTLREFAEWQAGSLEEYLYEWVCEDPEQVRIDDVDWDKEADPLSVLDAWPRTDLPPGAAHVYLQGLDLGTGLTGPDAVGGLKFYDGPFPGSDYLAVHATDEVSLSLLQKRLNDLGEKAMIKLF